jgi:hypothetical protein
MSPKVVSPAMPKPASSEIPSNLVRRAQSEANYRDDTGHNRTGPRLYSSAERSCDVHHRTIRGNLLDMHNSHLAAPPMATPIAITFYTTQWSHLRYGCCKVAQQRLCNDTTMIADMITGIIGLSTGRVQDSGAAIADRLAALNGKYNNPRIF